MYPKRETQNLMAKSWLSHLLARSASLLLFTPLSKTLTWVNWTFQGHLICLAASWSLDPRKASCRQGAPSETMGLLTPIMLRSRLHFCRLRTFSSILLQDSTFCCCNFSTLTANKPRLSFFDHQVKVFLGVIAVVTKGRWVARLLPLSHLLRLPLFWKTSSNTRSMLFTSKIVQIQHKGTQLSPLEDRGISKPA